MVAVAAFVLLASLVLALFIWRAREGRERTAELDETLARVREGVSWRRVVVVGGPIVALVLVAALARNPSRWPLLLLALGVVVVAVAAAVLAARRDG
jgi:Na+/H+ antiporter NhaD/arsenite permease-like protein